MWWCWSPLCLNNSGGWGRFWRPADKRSQSVLFPKHYTMQSHFDPNIFTKNLLCETVSRVEIIWKTNNWRNELKCIEDVFYSPLLNSVASSLAVCLVDCLVVSSSSGASGHTGFNQPLPHCLVAASLSSNHCYVNQLPTKWPFERLALLLWLDSCEEFPCSFLYHTSASLSPDRGVRLCHAVP